jgi:hypothetical protein
VRRELAEHTKYPVVVPTPTPAYNTTYRAEYLARRGVGWDADALPAEAAALARAVGSKEVRGYVRELAEYLADALRVNPKRGEGTGRTSLYGLQVRDRS